jgi:hypothetical protein
LEIRSINRLGSFLPTARTHLCKKGCRGRWASLVSASCSPSETNRGPCWVRASRTRHFLSWGVVKRREAFKNSTSVWSKWSGESDMIVEEDGIGTTLRPFQAQSVVTSRGSNIQVASEKRTNLDRKPSSTQLKHAHPFRLCRTRESETLSRSSCPWSQSPPCCSLPGTYIHYP